MASINNSSRLTPMPSHSPEYQAQIEAQERNQRRLHAAIDVFKIRFASFKKNPAADYYKFPAGNYEVYVQLQPNAKSGASIIIMDCMDRLEPLLNTKAGLQYPESVTRFKTNWEERQHLVPENFRLIIVMACIFSTLLNHEEPCPALPPS